jgi:hypothetical protein
MRTIQPMPATIQTLRSALPIATRSAPGASHKPVKVALTEMNQSVRCALRESVFEAVTRSLSNRRYERERRSAWGESAISFMI